MGRVRVSAPILSLEDGAFGDECPALSCLQRMWVSILRRGVLKLAQLGVAYSLCPNQNLPLRGSRQQSPRPALTLSCVLASGA